MSTVVLADVSMEKFKRPAGWCMWLKHFGGKRWWLASTFFTLGSCVGNVSVDMRPVQGQP
jgi:hypothetical protein